MEEAEPRGTGHDPHELLQQTVRTNRLLFSLLLVVACLWQLDRIGSRVYAVAVFDSKQGRFVEHAYLGQREQCEAVRAALLAGGRDKHPVYREHHDVFERARPTFREPVLIRRVRRVVRLADPPPTVDAPIQEAVALLTPVVSVVVDGFGIYADSNPRPLVVLASEAWAQQAVDTRLENVSDKVEAELEGIGVLHEAPQFVQQVTIRPVPSWPIDQIATVAGAVETLTSGDLRGARHTVRTGEERRLATIAEQYKCTVDDLEAWNAGRDLSLLKVGDTLIVRKPEPPVTVKTVEHRYPTVMQNVNGRPRPFRATVEIIRHDGVAVHRNEIRREPRN